MYLLIFLAISSLLFSFHDVVGGNKNPFTPQSYAIRYWNQKISNHLPKPSFLISKASPLSPADCALFAKLAGDPKALSDHLSDFCTKANLFCPHDHPPVLKKHRGDVDFSTYDDRNFTNYGSGHLGKADRFQTYSDHFGDQDENVFHLYSHDSIAHGDSFDTYAASKNMPKQNFNGYGTKSISGKGVFSAYNEEVNVPNLLFAAYSRGASGRKQAFSAYATEANSGEEGFASYARRGDGAGNEFTGYGLGSNSMLSSYKNYGEFSNGANDTFSSYGITTNIARTRFRNYATVSNGAKERFDRYRTDSVGGKDVFKSYGKRSLGGDFGFQNYGDKIVLTGVSRFSGYGRKAFGFTADFKSYYGLPIFKRYRQKGLTFSLYQNQSSVTGAGKKANANKWRVEAGRFFREKMLKNGTIMPFPDIRDKMPKRSFLPRIITSKLPFSTSKLNVLQTIFHIRSNSSMAATMLRDSLTECERPPNANETKECVASIEDMIDFAVSMLGQNVTVHTTNNTKGHSSNIMIGKVKGINGGKITKSVSCHESFFPYLLYYCHSVPKVRVYEAEILDPKSRVRINNGVAICHLDTGSWSADHGAFVALGPGPGKIEVCHWIFENDMTWTVVD